MRFDDQPLHNSFSFYLERIFIHYKYSEDKNLAQNNNNQLKLNWPHIMISIHIYHTHSNTSKDF